MAFFIAFTFVGGVTIMYWPENMNIYVSNIEESYKGAIIGYLRCSVTEASLFHIVQCWRSCAVDEEKRYLPISMYC